MSDSAIGMFLEEVLLPAINKASGDKGTRKELQRNPALSLFVIVPQAIKDGMDRYATEAWGKGQVAHRTFTQAQEDQLFLDPTTKETIINNFISSMQKIEKKIYEENNLGKDELDQIRTKSKELKTTIIEKKATGAVVVLSRKFETVKKYKQKWLTKPFLAAYKAKKGIGAAKYEKLEALTRGGRGEEQLFKTHKVGFDLGHGEFGAASSQVKAEQMKQKVAGSSALTAEEKATINEIFAEYELRVGGSVSHEQILDDNGNVRKGYVVTLSLQDAEGNARDASEVEGPAMKALTDQAQALLEQEGSFTFMQAIERVFLSALTRKSIREASVRYQGVRPKRNINEKSKARKKIRKGFKSGRRFKVIQEKKPLPKPTIERQAVKEKRPAMSSLALVNLINKNLPKVLIKNMQAPGLQNVTGRFANSVRALKIKQSGRGLPNVQYSYDYDPYQVFEVGKGDRRWATTERDPRNLIDQSIREVAIGIMTSKFTTTRL